MELPGGISSNSASRTKVVSLVRDLVRISATCFPGTTAGAFRNRARLIGAGLFHRRRVAEMLHAPLGSGLALALQHRAELMGALVWPYQCSAWNAGPRLDRIIAHYAEIDRLGPPFPFPLDMRLVLLDLDEVYHKLTIILDQPPWFMREGGLTLNLFVGNFRTFSLSFSLYRTANGALEAVIGGVQGRAVSGVADLYRDLTGALFGMRPRDFLIEVHRIMCGAIGVERILGVSDAQRYHRHPFFAGKASMQDYDSIWTERGGIQMEPHFYLLAVAPERRDLSTVKSNKRSLYRRRYAFLEDIEARIRSSLAFVEPVHFPDS